MTRWLYFLSPLSRNYLHPTMQRDILCIPAISTCIGIPLKSLQLESTWRWLTQRAQVLQWAEVIEYQLIHQTLPMISMAVPYSKQWNGNLSTDWLGSCTSDRKGYNTQVSVTHNQQRTSKKTTITFIWGCENIYSYLIRVWGLEVVANIPVPLQLSRWTLSRVAL